MVLPLPNRATQAILAANGALILGPRASVRSKQNAKGESTFGEVANLGEASTFLGDGSSVGSLFSNARVTLGAGATVNGPLTAGGKLVVPLTAAIKGKVSTNTFVSADHIALQTVKFTVEPAVAVDAGQTRTLAAGKYGDVRAESGSVLSLSAGTYYMTSLTISARATLALNEKAGAVVIFVRTSFVFAGEERQEGSDGHVLVASFGCEPSILSAPFRGSVSAQNSWLSLSAPGKQVFAGRFFANSIEVGPDITVSGLGLTLPGASAPGSTGQAARPPTPLPAPPPPVAGCYEMTANGWHSVACATQAFVDSHFSHPDTQLALESFSAPSLLFGQVEVTVPEVASEANVFNPTAYADNPSDCPSSITTAANRWSVQNNVNDWAITSGSNQGDLATDQFTLQSDGSTTGVCIWQIDVTSQNYKDIKCFSPQPGQRSGGLQAFDFGNIATTVNGGMLEMVAQLSWVPPGKPNTYAVVTTDDYGLATNWSNVGGGLIGYAECSQAQFADTEMVTQVAASTCSGDTAATSPTCAPPSLQPNESASATPLGTVETNNLTAIGAPSVTYPNSDLAVTSVTGTTTGGCLGPSLAYIKDSVSDFGATPSTLGNGVFWESPDIFLVPHGTPVDLNAVSTETTLIPGGQFDIWVRVHNDVGCSDVNNVRTQVYLADPAALSVQWSPVTGGQYVGNNGSATGVTVPSGGEALIGPLTYTAPASGIGTGHRCILAAVEADSESAPANIYDAADSNQVGQRNVQFSSPCVFPLTNSTTQNGSAQITLTATPNTGTSPSLTGLPDVEATFDDSDSSWSNAWSSQSGNGTAFMVTHAGAVTTVRLGSFSVALNSVPLNAGQSRNATANIHLPSGSGAVTLQIGATLTETDGSGTVILQNGGSCLQEPPPVIQ